MAAQILPFPNSGAATISPIACFLRIGEAHQRLGDLHAAERLPAGRVVIDASRFRHQRELMNAVRESGAEIVLNTEAAELASLAQCGGHSRRAPWARADGGPLGPDYFQKDSPTDVIGMMARFAVAGHFDTILAPTHYLGDPDYGDWLIGCGDRDCCRHGYSDMVSDPRRHAAYQLLKSVSNIEAVPDLRRETYFLDGPMQEAGRLARQIKLRRPSIVEAERRRVDEKDLMRRLEQHSRQMEQLLSMLEGLHQTCGDEGPRVVSVQSRTPTEQAKEDRR
jgi:hypothetical protein